MTLFTRLRTRMIAHIIWIVISVSLASSYLVYKLHERSIEEHLKSDALEISDIVENLLIWEMQHVGPKGLEVLLPQIVKMHHLVKLRILKPNGRIAFSSSGQEQEEMITTPFFFDFLATSSASASKFERNNSGTVFYKLWRLENEKECQSCHDPVQKINGVLWVETGDDMSLTVAKSEYIGLLFLAISAIVVLSFATSFLFIRSVDRPVRELKRAMDAIEQGDFSVRVNINSQNELGQLADGLNNMVLKLAGAHKRLLAYHRQELRGTEALAKTGELAASLAHEIKNPISGIVFAVNSLLREIPQDDERREIFEEIARQANSVEQNLEALLGFARHNRFELALSNLNAVVERILLFIHQQQDLQNIDLQSDLDKKLPSIWMDSKRIEQVLMNMIINAVQAMPNGGRITISTRYDSPANTVHLLIQDTGEGIPESDQQRIFQPFYTTKVQGTGLGLTLCREVINQHGGEITFESKPGEGTTFYIELPGNYLEAVS